MSRFLLLSKLLASYHGCKTLARVRHVWPLSPEALDQSQSLLHAHINEASDACRHQ